MNEEPCLNITKYESAIQNASDHARSLVDCVKAIVQADQELEHLHARIHDVNGQRMKLREEMAQQMGSLENCVYSAIRERDQKDVPQPLRGVVKSI